MKMPHATLIELDVWGTGLYLLVGGDNEGIKKWQNRELAGYKCFVPDHKGDEGCYDHASNKRTGHKAHLLWIAPQRKDPEGLGTIAHEVTHAAIGILRFKGVSLNKGSEESYAYLVDYITQKVIETMNRKRLWKR